MFKYPLTLNPDMAILVPILAGTGVICIGVGSAIFSHFLKKAAALYDPYSEIALRLKNFTPLKAFRKQYPTNDPQALILINKGLKIFIVFIVIGLIVALAGLAISFLDVMALQEYANSLQ